jgi:hypothetical protein
MSRPVELRASGGYLFKGKWFIWLRLVGLCNRISIAAFTHQTWGDCFVEVYSQKQNWLSFG